MKLLHTMYRRGTPKGIQGILDACRKGSALAELDRRTGRMLLRRHIAHMPLILASGSQVDVSHAIRKLTRLWGNSSVAGSESLMSAIAFHMPRDREPFVIECGSGGTTVLGVALTKWLGGGWIALEHSEAWAQILQRDLSAIGADPTRVRHCPLIDRGEYEWYSYTPDASMPEITMLLVDGPPTRATKGGRFGAVAELYDRLAPGAIIILDDTNRTSEQQTMRDWTSSFGIEWSIYDHQAKGVAVGRVPARG